VSCFIEKGYDGLFFRVHETCQKWYASKLKTQSLRDNGRSFHRLCYQEGGKQSSSQGWFYFSRRHPRNEYGESVRTWRFLSDDAGQAARR